VRDGGLHAGGEGRVLDPQGRQRMPAGSLSALAAALDTARFPPRAPALEMCSPLALTDGGRRKPQGFSPGG